MINKRLVLLVASIIVVLCTTTVFAAPITSPEVHITGTPTIGAGAIEGVNITLTSTDKKAISITGDANATLHNDIELIKVATSTTGLTDLVAINVSGTRPTLTDKFSRPSLSINSGGVSNYVLTIELGGASRVDGILVKDNGLFSMNGDLKIEHSGFGEAIRVEGVVNLTDILGGIVNPNIHFVGDIDISFKDATSAVNERKVGIYVGLNYDVQFDGNIDISIENGGSHLIQGLSYGLWVGGTADSKFEVNGNTTIYIEGLDAAGIRHFGYGTNAIYNGNVNITTDGDGASGFYKTNRDVITIKGKLDITTNGDKATISGREAVGLYISSTVGQTDPPVPSLSVLGDTTIVTNGVSGTGISIANSVVNLSKVTVTTNGEKAYGIYLTNSTTVFGDTTITTLGDGAAALYASGTPNSGGFAFDKLDILAEGASSWGIYATGRSSIHVKDSAAISLTGTGGYGIVILGSTILTFDKEAKISTSGTGSHGLHIRYSASGPSTVKFLGGGSITTTGSDAYAIVFTTSSDNSVFNNMKVSSSSGNLIYNAYLATDTSPARNLKVAFSGASELHGNIYNDLNSNSSTYGKTSLELSGTSFLRGGTNNVASDIGAAVNLTLLESAYWDIAGNYRLDSVTMGNNNRILFSYLTPNTYYTATADILTGSGTIVINADVSTAAGAADLLLIGKATGSFKLSVIDRTPSGIDAETDEITVITVVDLTDAPTFTLTNAAGVLLGKSLYVLEEDAATNSWKLVKTPIGPGILDGTNTSMVGLFELAKSIDASISDELLSSKKTVWAIAGYKRQNFRGLPTNDDLKQNIFNLIAGMDIASKEDWNFGVFIGLTIGNQDVNEVIVSTTDAFTLGFNAVYERNGLIASGYVRLASYLHSIEVIDSPSLMNGRLVAFGFSASAQAAKSFYVADTGIFLAPKAKLSFTHLFGFEHDFSLLKVTGQPASALVIWAGARAGIDLLIKDIPVTPYVEAGFIYDTNPKITVFVNNVEEAISLGATCYEFGAGFDIKPSESSSFTFEYKFSISKNIVEPIKIKIVATTSF